MPLVQDLSEAQLVFQIADGQPDDFLVLRYRGTEGLGQLYRFEIELSSTLPTVQFDSVVGQAAVLSINTPQGPRSFHGIISRFEMTDETTDLNYFRAELVPDVWLLTHRYRSRIFQNKTVQEIVAQVLEDAGIPSDRVRFATADREPREYCVQYRETDYNFICRLLEEEGIRWYFAQQPDGHTLVMADHSAEYAPIEGDPQLPYNAATGLNVDTEHVYRFRMGQGVRPGAVVLDDFNFENPKLNLKAPSDCGRNASLEFFDYPGEYVTQSEGSRYAEIRAQEFEAGRTLGVGLSNCARLAVGFKFELIEHPSTALNREYLVTAITHEGRQSTTRTTAALLGRGGLLEGRIQQSLHAALQHEDRTIADLAAGLLQIAALVKSGDRTARRELTRWLYHAGQVARDLSSAAGASGAHPLAVLGIPNLLDDITDVADMRPDAEVYQCRFECIPATVVYRPARVTPWPVMRGLQTARVVGPEGEEIHTDEYGRVKVKFNWDRENKFDDSASCWIRVSQGMAGGQYGMMFLPRIGQEVVVDFLEGDPDKPLITGRVYNADQMPPYKLPDEKTKSVIKTNSSKGGEGTNEIRFEDLKDSEQILIYAQKDFHLRTKHDRVENVENDCHLTVGHNRYEQVQKDYHLILKEGDKIEEIAKDHSLKVTGKVSIQIDGTSSTQIGADVVEKLAANHKHDVAATYALKAASIKLEASSGIELKCGGSSLVLTPSAIFVVGGPTVNINSGSGPPVSPVTASATSPVAPEAPLTADEVKPGKDTTYGGAEAPPAAAPVTPLEAHEFEAEAEEVVTTWISIELVDEADVPVPGERYEITAPDGRTIRRGSLDANGKAYVMLPEPTGECQITFPDLDSAAWERI